MPKRRVTLQWFLTSLPIAVVQEFPRGDITWGLETPFSASATPIGVLRNETCNATISCFITARSVCCCDATQEWVRDGCGFASSNRESQITPGDRRARPRRRLHDPSGRCASEYSALCG